MQLQPYRADRRSPANGRSSPTTTASVNAAHSRAHDASSERERQLLDVGRPQLGSHREDDEPLLAIRACEPVDLQLPGRAEDLEREEVLPLRPARVEHRPGAGLALAEDHDGVVLDVHRPERGAEQRAVKRQRPEQRVAQVEQVHPLVDELAAAGPRAVGPPLALVADPAAVPVAAAHME